MAAPVTDAAPDTTAAPVTAAMPAPSGVPGRLVVTADGAIRPSGTAWLEPAAMAIHLGGDTTDA